MALLIFSVLISFALLEIFSGLVYSYLSGNKFNKDEIRGRLLEKSSTGEAVEGLQVEDVFMPVLMLHPYLGFVLDPSQKETINKFGFVGPPYHSKSSDDKVVIGIFGGSVALHLYLYARDELIAELKNNPECSDKDIEVVNFSNGGFKQPQQLLALTYFLSLGSKFDIVINLDGFNEIVLPYHDNVKRGIYPFFPRNWSSFTRKALDPSMIKLAGKLEFTRESRESNKRLFSRGPLSHSRFFLALWGVLDIRNQATQYVLQREMDSLSSSKKLHPQATGPFEPYKDEETMFKDFAIYWRSVSVQMDEICKTRDIRYFHFLQPNQYVAGTKKLTEEELRNAYISGDFGYKYAVEKGYGLMIKEGKSLRLEGVNFTDLTMLFKDEERTLYNDTCCHMNLLGNKILAKEIAGAIIANSEFSKEYIGQMGR